MRNAFLLITNTMGHAEEEWNTKVPPRGHQIGKDTTLRSRETEGYPRRHWQPKDETRKSREGAHIYQQRTQEHLGCTEATREHHCPTGEETSEEREAQTQRIQPLPKGQDVGRHEHDRRCQGMEGERGRIALILRETARSRLAVPITAILAHTSPVEEQRREEKQLAPSTTLFLFSEYFRYSSSTFRKIGKLVLTRSSWVN